ncbi:MAG: hypothetical protein WC346_18680 [Methanogenium sp.]|jgi:hypothetical protein
MNADTWKTITVSVAILIAIFSIPFGGLWQIIIPGSVVLAVMHLFWKHGGIDLYIFAIGQMLVYGASYGSYLTAIICEASLFAAIAGKMQSKLLILTFIMLAILGTITQMIYHTGWWIAGLVVLCGIFVISGYVRKEALSRSLRGEIDE